MAVHKGKSTVTMVAKRAGVSVGTVSRVLNKHPNVSAQRRAAVERAMSELNYRPHPVARTIRKLGTAQRLWTGNIGVVFTNTAKPTLRVPVIAGMMHGAQEALTNQGYHLLISNTTDTSSLPDIVRDDKVEGLLLHGDLDPSLCEEISQLVPAVSMGQNNVTLSLPMVNVNNRAAMVSGMKYLFELGHRRIGFICLEPNRRDNGERLDGYRQAYEVLGLPYDPGLESLGPPRANIGPRYPEAEPPKMDALAAPLLELEDRPTALIVVGDWHTIDVYRLLRERGLGIPEDMSVIGFDNDERICQSLSPALTSLEYPAERIAQRAVTLLMEGIRNGREEMDQTVLVPSRLIRRNSCDKPKR